MCPPTVLDRGLYATVPAAVGPAVVLLAWYAEW
jgi:hypothetical protein